MNAIMTGFIYLFMKRSHPPMREKKKNNRPSDQKRKTT